MSCPQDAKRLLDLAAEVRRSDTAAGAFAVAVWAEYGVATPIGRIMDKITFLNSNVRYYLGETAWNLTELRSTEESSDEPSPVAAQLLAHERSIGRSRRRVAMPPATREAAIAWLTERRALFVAALELLSNDRRRAKTKRELKDLDRVAVLLGEPPRELKVRTKRVKVIPDAIIWGGLGRPRT